MLGVGMLLLVHGAALLTSEGPTFITSLAAVLPRCGGHRSEGRTDDKPGHEVAKGAYCPCRSRRR